MISSVYKTFIQSFKSVLTELKAELSLKLVTH